MSKHAMLTDEELIHFVPPKRTLHYIEEYRRKLGLQPSQMNILEWGCGRGRETVWFRERGYNAYGVDVDSLPVENGKLLLRSRGIDPSALKVLSADGKCDFPDGFFHFTYSNQVFEHVRDLDAVASELWRVSQPGAEAHHVYPAHKYIVEGHLFMPFVHWLPKSELRHRMISLFVKMGREPRWPELVSADAKNRAATYYAYSVEKTFYRSPGTIARIFDAAGFSVTYETINHPRVRDHIVLGPMSCVRGLRSVVDFLLLNFVSNELHLVKHGRS